MENARGERSSARQQINPVKAKVDMLIKEKLDKNNKKCSNYNKRKKRMSDMIEYYDYEDDEGQRRDALINEREINKFSTDDKAKIKRGKNVSITNKVNYSKNYKFVKFFFFINILIIYSQRTKYHAA